jgi:hypothetical protein
MASHTEAAPITISFFDGDYSARGSALGQTTGLPIIRPGVPAWTPVLTLPRFDPAWGTLQSVRLSARLDLSGLAITHCEFAVFCSAEAEVAFFHEFRTGQTELELGVELGDSFLPLVATLVVGCSDIGFVAACEDTKQVISARTYDWTFVGAALGGFIGTTPFSFYDSLRPGQEPFLGVQGTHTGLPFSGLLETYADDGHELIALAALISIALQATSNDPMHAGGFSHTHFAGASARTVWVDYTFEPTATVSEPATFGLLLAGAARLIARRRRPA